MKTLHRLMAIALALVLTLSLSAAARAAEPTAFRGAAKITVVNDASGYSYSAYKLFGGDLAVTEDNDLVLSNIVWGSGVDGDAVLAELKDAREDPLAGLKVAASAEGANAASIAAAITDQATAKAFVAFLAEKNLLPAASATASTQTDITSGTNSGRKGYVLDLSRSGYGYYLVMDSEPNGTWYSSSPYPTTNMFNTDFIMQVVGTQEVLVKGDLPTVEKKVKEVNDSTGTTSDWQDAADFDFNDEMTFRLLGTVASNIADFETYYYCFYDLMDGMTYTPNSAVVTVYPDKASAEAGENGTVITSNPGVRVVYAQASGDEGYASRLTIEIENLKASGFPALTASSVVVVTYNSALSIAANINSDGTTDGLPNKVRLTYSNNPNGNERGTTPWDEVAVFTYHIVVNKFNDEDESQPLAGAGFTLYKWIPSAETADSGEDSSEESDETASGEWVAQIPYAAQGSGEGRNVFTFKGKDAGLYKLVETTVPAGYNKVDDLIFWVKGTYAAESEDGVTAPKLTALHVYKEDGTTSFDSTSDVEDNRVFTSTLDATHSLVSTNVINHSGTVLPSTGGIGTTIFYVVGGLLIAVAVVLLVTRRRMRYEK